MTGYISGLLGRVPNNPKMDFSENEEMIRRFFNLNANNNVINTNAPNERQSPILSQLAHGLAQQLINEKAAYGSAEDESQRQLAHANADIIRKVASNNGVDLSQYGADVTLPEAQANLKSNDYRSLSELFSNDMSSDEYFGKIYRRLREKGYSDNESTREAGRQAQLYKYKRMTRLGNALNTYGKNDQSLNAIGIQILARMMTDAPEVANFYAAALPGVREDYARDNAIAAQNRSFENTKSLTNQQYDNQKSLMDQQHANNSETLVQKAQLNEDAADAQLKRNKEMYAHRANVDYSYGRRAGDDALERDIKRIDATGDQTRRTQTHQSRLGVQEYEDKKSIDLGNIEKELMAQLNARMTIAQVAGYGPGSPEFREIVYGIKPTPKTGQTVTTPILNAAKTIVAERRARYTDIGGTVDNEALESDVLYQEAIATIREIEGINPSNAKSTPDESRPIIDLTMDWNNDQQYVHKIREEMSNDGYSTAEIKETVYQIFYASALAKGMEKDAADDYAKRVAGLPPY